MNTTTARYTPLESLLLFQSLLSHGIEAAAFLQISSLLQNNKLVKGSSHYDAGRLRPEALQELFLHLLREELKGEAEVTEKPDGPGLSPNSRKRKLASPPLPTLQEARQYVEKLPVLVDRLYARYRDHIVREIRDDEERYDALQVEIHDIEAGGSAVRNVNSDSTPSATVPPTTIQNGHTTPPISGISGEVKLPNGVPTRPQASQQQQQQQALLQTQSQPQRQPEGPGQPQGQHSGVQPSPLAQPEPSIQQQQPPNQPQPHSQQQFVPVQQPKQADLQPGPQLEDIRNGATTPQSLPAPQERPGTATPPVLTSQHTAALPNQPSRLAPPSVPPSAPPSATPSVRQQEQPRPPNGAPQVLQPPQGVGFPQVPQGTLPQHVQGEGLQRPEGIGRGRTSPGPLPNQTAVPGQLKWEPLYQPSQNPTQYRQPQGQVQYTQQRQPVGPQAPQGQQQPPNAQWNSQASSPYGSPRPLHVQPGPQANQPLQQPLQQPVQQGVQQQPMQHPAQLLSQQQPLQQHATQQLQRLQAQQQTSQPRLQPQLQPQPQPNFHPGQVPQQAQQQQGQPGQPLYQQQGQQPVHQAMSQPGPTPGLLPPQKSGQFAPTLQPAPVRTPSGQAHVVPPGQMPALGQGPAPQQRPSLPPGPLAPGVYAANSPVSPFQSPAQGRALAAASPTPPSGSTPVPTPSQQRKRTGPLLGAAQPTAQPIAQRPSPGPQSGGPSVAGAPAVPPYAPQSGQSVPPRSAVPEHVLQQQANRQYPAVGTPTPVSRISSASAPAPQTPLQPFRRSYVLGSGTSWKLSKTPSTPRAEEGEVPSPAFEALSPVLAPATLPAAPPAMPAVPAPSPHESLDQRQLPSSEVSKSVAAKEPQGSLSPVAKRRGRPPRSVQKPSVAQSPAPSVVTLAPPPGAVPPQLTPDPAGPLQSTKETDATLIKNEETTPQPPTETGDTTADESVTGRREAARAVKRKRQDTGSPTPTGSRDPPGPPTHVLWTRSFNKVSHSAMEQIVGHRDANLFAHQIRERDAPGYRNRILMPQDLRSIRNAINHGNRAAAAAAAALPDGDPGTSNVLLPISEELVPPKGIVNSSQLDCELAHMLANAIMYNPDPNRGPGPAFMRSEAEVDAEDEENGAPVLGYKVDENGIVNNARAMFVEVEKLLSDMRAAEIQKGAPAATAALTGTSTRQASVAGGQGETPAKGPEAGSLSTAADDREEQTPTEPETTGNVSKRRRITRG